VILKPGPHLPKTQLPTFIVAFSFAALLIVSWMYAAVEGHPPPGFLPRGQRWGPITRFLGGAAALGLLAAITYPPRLPFLIPLLFGVIWMLRRNQRPQLLSP
ncbi:hypothetical protein MYX19_04315, partial [Nitrospinae bacterium AH-259-F20]|nr:hypothetical protein [Nitrospinae bacterium AH-259-F20]